MNNAAKIAKIATVYELPEELSGGINVGAS